MAAAKELSAVTTNVLRLSSINAYRAERRLVSIPEVVDRAISLTDSEVNRKATVQVCHDGEVFVLGSVGRLTQVVANLLVNAAHAIRDRGCIMIRTCQTDTGTVQVSVRDTGSGMETALHEKVFQPFFTTKTVEQGTGLGLALARDVVQEHGGQISLASSFGCGSCFTIHLPAASRETAVK